MTFHSYSVAFHPFPILAGDPNAAFPSLIIALICSFSFRILASCSRSSRSFLALYLATSAVVRVCAADAWGLRRVLPLPVPVGVLGPAGSRPAVDEKEDIERADRRGLDVWGRSDVRRGLALLGLPMV